MANKQGSGIGGRGYTPLAGKILNIPPPEDLEKNIPPSAAQSAAAIFLGLNSKIYPNLTGFSLNLVKLTLI